jgi:hypothetical protein
MQATLVQQSKAIKMYKVYLIIGKYNVEAFNDECFEDIDSSKVNCFKFKTVNEKVAFCGGIQLTADYDNYCFIDKDEYEMIINL